MVFKIKLRYVGNSCALILNETLIAHLNVKIGDEVAVGFSKNGLLLHRKKERGKK